MKSKMVRLCEYIAAASTKPFRYGVNDCLTFVAGATKELTGRDPIPHLRGAYNSPLTAQRKTREYGGLGEVAASCATEIRAGEADAGDWALVKNWDGNYVLGIVIGATVWAKAKHGVATCSRERAERFFRP